MMIFIRSAFIHNRFWIRSNLIIALALMLMIGLQLRTSWINLQLLWPSLNLNLISLILKKLVSIILLKLQGEPNYWTES